jgi:hypothetical protein
MQVTLNTQNMNNQTNFTSLKKVSGGKMLKMLLGDEGRAIEKDLVSSLKSNKAFQTLCNEYDVYVNIEPHAYPVGMILDKALSLNILVNKIKRGGFFGLFKKAPQKEKVSGYVVSGVEMKTKILAQHIIDDYINVEKGMADDINKFLKKAASVSQDKNIKKRK